MDWTEQNEIVDQVLIRLNELSDSDKKTRAIMNRKVMIDACKEQSKRVKEDLFRADSDIDIPHAWHAIWEINKLVPWIISVRYSSNKNENAFYKAHPNVTERRAHCCSVANQMLIEDKKLAEQIAKELTDILFKYMKPEVWDENYKE